MGEPAWELSAAGKERLGYVPQKIDLYPWMKIRQITAYTGAFYPRWNKALVERLLREWELNPEDRVGLLSVGQTQKLAIILALGHEPDLLVLDEPAASLDPVARRQFLATLLAMVGERTVLFSTHITSDLERVADRVAVLKDGKIVYSRELDALKDGVKRLHVQAAAPLPNGSFRVPGMLHAKVTGNEAVVSVQDFTADLPERIAQQWASVLPHYRKKHLLVTTLIALFFLAIPMFTMEFVGTSDIAPTSVAVIFLTCLAAGLWTLHHPVLGVGAGGAGVRHPEALRHFSDRLSVIQPPTRAGFPNPGRRRQKVLTVSCRPDCFANSNPASGCGSDWRPL